MEKLFVRIIYLIVGIGVVLNTGHSLLMNMKVWAGEPRREEFKVMPQNGTADTAGPPFSETQYGPAQPAKTDLEEKALSYAETKYLSKAEEVAQSTSVLGQRLAKSAPKWWDQYHPILKSADKLTARLKKPYSQADHADIVQELDSIDGKFIALNEKVTTDIRRFFASLEVAKILASKPPESMSDAGKDSLKSLAQKMSETEQKTREALWTQHIIENPNDKKNGWSCRIVIRTLISEVRTLLSNTSAKPENGPSAP